MPGKAKGITAKDEYQYIAQMIGTSMKNLSRSLSGTEEATGFRFTEEYNKDEDTLTITLLSKKPAHKEIAIQAFRYRIDKQYSKYEQFVMAYKGFLNYLLSTSLTVLDNVANQMNSDEELQKESKLII